MLTSIAGATDAQAIKSKQMQSFDILLVKHISPPPGTFKIAFSATAAVQR